MKGQWLGELKGTNNGKAIINIDEVSDSFIWKLYFYEDESSSPPIVVHFKVMKCKFIKGLGECTSQLIYPLDPNSLTQTYWDSIKLNYPNVTFPTETNLSFEQTEIELKLSAKTNVGTELSGIFTRHDLSAESELSARTMTWFLLVCVLNFFVVSRLVKLCSASPLLLRWHPFTRFKSTTSTTGLLFLPSNHPYIYKNHPPKQKFLGHLILRQGVKKRGQIQPLWR